MFRKRLDKSTFPRMAPAVAGLIMIVIGPCLTCPCQGAVRAEFPFVDSSQADRDSEPCECCNACPKKATCMNVSPFRRPVQQLAGIIRVPTVLPRRPVYSVGSAFVRPVLPPPGVEELQVFLE